MAVVKCKYCGKQFDREKEAFVQIPYGATFRYAHGDCYIKAKENNVEIVTYEIWDPKLSTFCFWCHKAIFPNQPDVMPMPQLKDRYVHKKCAETHPADEKEELKIYLIDLFKLKDDYIIPKYMKQITQYQTEYNYTYSGMLKALKYWYGVKKNPVDLDRGVGIIPYIYKTAYDYYYALYLSDLQNQKIEDYEAYKPQDIEVSITPPQRKIEKRKLFTFLDEEQLTNE